MIKKFYKKHEKAIKIVTVAGIAAAGYIIGLKISTGKANPVSFVSDLEPLMNSAASGTQVVKIGEGVLKNNESFATAIKHISDLSEKEIIGIKVWFNDD